MMINLSDEQKESIEAIDSDVLQNAVDKARETRSPAPLNSLQLHRLGSYVRSTENKFHQALKNLSKAKSTAKISSTEQVAISAGWDLVSAVEQMKQRVIQEKSDGERFYVDDHIHAPFTFLPNMSVSVSYRWRPSEGDGWTSGHIIFNHHHTSQPRYETLSDRRKLSERQRERELQEKWDHLRDLALHSVRDFFRDGGDGADIPEIFDAVTDNGSLNNFSLNFWHQHRDRVK